METLTEIFWCHVTRDNGCWAWRGSKTTKGYGRFKLSKRTYAAHRISYELHFGKIKKGLVVCHSCDNPSCVNPGHLWLGTHADNQRDCFQKGRRAHGQSNGKYTRPDRTPRGSTSGMSKVTEADIPKIRDACKNRSQQSVADEYGVTQASISAIVLRKTWAHVA